MPRQIAHRGRRRLQEAAREGGRLTALRLRSFSHPCRMASGWQPMQSSVN